MEPVLQLEIALPVHGSREILHALHRQLRGAIVEGRLAAGLRLPSSRSLALSCGVARNTVLAAYDLLLAEGYIVTRPGGGTFVGEVAARGSAAPSGPARPSIAASEGDPRLNERWRTPPALVRLDPSANYDYDFILGLPDKRTFAFDVWRRLSARALRGLSRAPAVYAEPEGRAALREAIAHHVSYARAVACEAEDVVVTAGAQQAFDLLARVLVTPGKTVVALEDPGYPPLRRAFALAGARIVGIRVDAEGIVVDDLPPDARVICVTPSHQFPLGIPMSAARRRALLAFAQRHGAVVIEDDYDGEFRHDDRPLDALQTLDRHASVCYVGTFSKCLFPGLRMGYVVAPAWVRDALVAARQCADWHGNLLAQDTLAAFLREGHLVRHIRKMRTQYRTRRDALLAALTRHCGAFVRPVAPAAGLHLAAGLDAGVRADALVTAATRAGVRVQALAGFAVAPETALEGLVFGFGMIEAQRIDAAVARLAACVR
jgi:GntR family transcriptional regulator/MocR family aminotransferase